MILVIGYGNPLRTDDGLGPCIAEIMEDRLKHEDVQVATAHQLTPEWVDSVSHASLVVFIDARIGDMPGRVMYEPVAPEMGQAFTHNVRPGTLLGAAHELYRATPDGLLISIIGANFDYGSALSDVLQHKLAEIANQVEAIIRSKANKYPKGNKAPYFTVS